MNTNNVERYLKMYYKKKKLIRIYVFEIKKKKNMLLIIIQVNNIIECIANKKVFFFHLLNFLVDNFYD